MKTRYNVLRSAVGRQVIAQFLLMALVPLAIVFVSTSLNERRAVENLTKSKLEAVGAGRSGVINQLIESHVQQITALAGNPQVLSVAQGGLPPESSRDILHCALSVAPAFTSLALVDTNGRVIQATGEGSYGADFSGLSVFESALMGPTIDPLLQYSESAGQMTFRVAAPMHDPIDGHLLAVIVAEVGTTRLEQVLAIRDGLGETGAVYLVSAEGVMLGGDQTDAEATSVDLDEIPGIREAFAGEVGVARYVNHHGDDVWEARYPIPATGWALMVGVGTEQGDEIFRHLNIQMGITGLVTTAIVVVISILAGRFFALPILSLLDVANAMERGDLTHSVSIGSRPKDEIDALNRSLSAALVAWRKIIGDMRGDAVHLSTTAAQLASSSEELSRTTASQSDEITRTSTAIEQMAATIQEVARSAEVAAQAASESSERAKSGGTLVLDTAAGLKHADETVQQLSAHSEEIGKIVGLIQDVAAQTNILAINAAIEAAGAGQAGARFDVVAEEIRKLAARTSRATGEVGALIDAVQQQTRAVAKVMAESTQMAQKSGEALASIVKGSAAVQDMIQNISLSTEEQSRTSEEIAGSLDAMVDSSRQTVLATREMAQIGIELSDLADRLKDTASTFST